MNFYHLGESYSGSGLLSKCKDYEKFEKSQIVVHQTHLMIQFIFKNIWIFKTIESLIEYVGNLIYTGMVDFMISQLNGRYTNFK